MERNQKILGHLALFAAYLIFGINIVACKDLTTSGMFSPMALFTIRSLGAGSIFWILSAFQPKEKVAPKDFVGIFFASLLGFFLTQLTFLVAIPLITPMESSLISSLSPIFTMFIAALVLHEPITLKKISGVVVSFLGITYLILNGINGEISSFGQNIRGIVLMVMNVVCFSCYLGMFRPLIRRYSVVTFMKWIFLFAVAMSLPISFSDVVSADYGAMTPVWILELAFLVIFATFFSYFLIPFGQKSVRPTIVSMYSYVQPVVAIALSIIVGYDTLTVAKVAATLMVFIGVYIVSRSKSATP